MGGKKEKRVHPWVRLESTMLNSVAFRSLGSLAKALLVDLVNLYNGFNNGQLFLSRRDAAAAQGIADLGAIGRAFRELEDRGFISITTPGAFSRKERHATAYRLTWQPWNEQAPTNEWRRWQPQPGTKGWTRLQRTARTNLQCGKAAQSVLETCTPARGHRGFDPMTVQETGTAKSKNPAIAAPSTSQETNTQLSCHTPPQEMATASERDELRSEVRDWLKSVGTQQQLACVAGVNASKLSRFMSDPDNRRDLTRDQWHQLRMALSALRDRTVVTIPTGRRSGS